MTLPRTVGRQKRKRNGPTVSVEGPGKLRNKLAMLRDCAVLIGQWTVDFKTADNFIGKRLAGLEYKQVRKSHGLVGSCAKGIG